MQIRVETGRLRESATELAEVLARLERVRMAEDLTVVGSAFRGGQVASAAPRACLAWGEGLAALRGRVRATGAALDSAATGYEVVEDIARSALEGSRRR
ncbi:MAG: hypothetical protein JWP82_2145 [Humibacillus sp.]|nr:hypothetical protein [Humibacillus sp.]